MKNQIKSFAMTFVFAFLLTGSVLLILGGQVSSAKRAPAWTQNTGGPDDFGYVYTDSLAAPALYNWVDIAASGTPITFANPDTAHVQLNFPESFTFYGEEYTKLYLTTNGYATFNFIYASDIITQCSPTERFPANTLAAFCTDLASPTVYYSTTTSYNGHETFIIQYDQVTQTASGMAATFQIILDLEENAIIYQYLSLPPNPGITTTVGIIGYAGNWEDALTYCGGATNCPPQAELAVQFALTAIPALELGMTADNDFPAVGDTITYTIQLDNLGGFAPAAAMTNTLPAGLNFVDATLAASSGSAAYDPGSRAIHWEGDLERDTPVTLTYAAVLNTGNYIYNSAILNHPKARRPASGTISPAETWEALEILDAPHLFDYRLGSWRHIAVDDTGTIHAAYAGAALYYAHLPVGSTVWISETVPGTIANIWRTSLQLDDQDRPIIAFYGSRKLWLASLADEGWHVEEIAEIGSASTYLFLDLARGADGSLHLVYNELANSSTSNLYYTVNYGAGWSAPVIAVPHTACRTYDTGFSLALNGNNVPHVACAYSGSIPRATRVYTYSENSPWTDFTTVASGNNFYYFPSLAFDGNTPHVAFFEGNRAVYHAQHDGANWQVTLVDDSAPVSYLRQFTSLGINGGQVGIASALRTGSYGNYQARFQYATRPLTGTLWATEVVTTFGYTTDDPRPSLAMDTSGEAHLAYYHQGDRVLYHAPQLGGFVPDVVDERRTLGGGAVALSDAGDIHVAWFSEGLRYAVSAADSYTFTRQSPFPIPEMGSPALSLAVDGGDVPHLFYAEHSTPLYHATLSNGDWMTRVVDIPGDTMGFDSDAEAADSAHVAYIAEQGGNHVLRYGFFNPVDWITETVTILSPAAWNHDQKPRVVVQQNKVYILYADCTQNRVGGADYPITLKLATWDGVSWAHDPLYNFIGQCDWRLTYQLAGDDAGRLSGVAHINSDSVRPQPLIVSLWIEDAGSMRYITQQENNKPGMNRQEAEQISERAPMMMSYIIQAMLRGDGGMATWNEYGMRIFQHWDREGNLSKKIIAEALDTPSIVLDGAGDGSRSVVVEKLEYENKLRVPRAVRKPAPEIPVLSLSGEAALQDLCPDEAFTDTVTVLNVTLAVNELADWEATSISFQGLGTGDEQVDIELVELYLGGQLLSSGVYPSDDGQITLAIGRRIPAGTSITLRLDYTFKEQPTTPWPVKTFDVTTRVSWVNAEPVEPPFPSYEKLPPTPISSGEHVIAVVRNTNTQQGFTTIQSAVSAATTQDGHSIAVCPGIYTENVAVNKSLNIYGIEGFLVTTVAAANPVQSVFTTEKAGTNLQGFTIRGAGEAFGVQAMNGITLKELVVRDNLGGVYQLQGFFLAENIQVRQNSASGFSFSDDGTNTAVFVNVVVQDNGGNGIHATQRNVNIQGASNQFANNGGYGILGGMKSNVTIEGGSVIHGNGEMGIFTNGKLTIQDGAMDLIHLNQGGGIAGLEGVSIPAGFIVENNGGAGIIAGGNSTLVDVKVLNNKGVGIGYMQTAGAAGELKLLGTDNQIVGNGGDGIQNLDLNGKVTIEGATQIHGNGGWGILSAGPVKIIAGAMDKIHDNGKGGIMLNGSEGTLDLPPGFIVENNGGPGIVISVETILVDVKVLNNQGDGIGFKPLTVSNEKYMIVLKLSGTDNRVVGNGGDGINIAGGKVTIEGTTQIHSNGGWGILSGGLVKITAGAMDRIHDNGKGGIYASWYGENLLSLPNGFIVENNGGPGIAVVGSTSLRNVIVRGNQGEGIHVMNGDLTLRGEDTIISQNGKSGIRVDHGNADLVDSQIISNGAWAIWATGGQGGSLVKLADVQVDRNHAGGIRVEKIDLQIKRMMADRNLGTGVAITRGTAKIQNSQVSRNAGYGILAVGSDLNMEGTLIFENTLGGVMMVSAGTGGRVAEVISSIFHSTIQENSGDGIHFAGGTAGLIVQGSNLLQNTGYALVNAHPSQGVAAQDNWWGGPGSPAAVISGTVDYTPWNTSAFSLTAFVASDPAYTARGVTTTLPIYIQNWQHINETVQLTVTDVEGWLVGPLVFTTTLADGVGGMASLNLYLPEGTGLGTASTVTATVESLDDPSATAVVTFQVVAASVADLSAGITRQAAAHLTGEPFTYTLTITNAGPGAATGLVLTNTLPTTVTITGANPSQGTCSQGTGGVRCEAGEISAGGWITVLITATAQVSGQITNLVEAWGSAHDPHPADNNALAIFAVREPTAPSAVAITGPVEVQRHTLTDFTAEVTPAHTTGPITYTWQASGQWWSEMVLASNQVSQTNALMWHKTGTQIITVTVKNIYGEAITSTFALTVTEGQTNQPPVADAGPNQAVKTLSLVTLDGSGSSDPDGHLPLTYLWQQTGGIAVNLSDPTTANPTFTTPGSETVLTFTLMVNDSLGLPAPSPAEVVVQVQMYRLFLPLVTR